MTIKIQVKATGVDWEDIPQHEQTFIDRKAIVDFAYRLALVSKNTVRVEYDNGVYYYDHQFASDYLK